MAKATRVAGSSDGLTHPATDVTAFRRADGVYAEPPSAAGWIPTDNGLLLAVCDMAAAGASAAMVGGSVYLGKMVVRRDVTVSRVWFQTSVAGTGSSTGSYVGLYSQAGTRLAQSTDADATAAFKATAGPQSVALDVPQALKAGTFVWAALVENLDGTQPSLTTYAATIAARANLGLPPSQYRAASGGTGQTTLPSSLTVSSQSAANPIWMGLS